MKHEHRNQNSKRKEICPTTGLIRAKPGTNKTHLSRRSRTEKKSIEQYNTGDPGEAWAVSLAFKMPSIPYLCPISNLTFLLMPNQEAVVTETK